MLKGIGTEP